MFEKLRLIYCLLQSNQLTQEEKQKLWDLVDTGTTSLFDFYFELREGSPILFARWIDDRESMRESMLLHLTREHHLTQEQKDIALVIDILLDCFPELHNPEGEQTIKDTMHWIFGSKKDGGNMFMFWFSYTPTTEAEPGARAGAVAVAGTGTGAGAGGVLTRSEEEDKFYEDITKAYRIRWDFKDARKCYHKLMLLYHPYTRVGQEDNYTRSQYVVNAWKRFKMQLKADTEAAVVAEARAIESGRRRDYTSAEIYKDVVDTVEGIFKKARSYIRLRWRQARPAAAPAAETETEPEPEQLPQQQTTITPPARAVLLRSHLRQHPEFDLRF